MAETSNPFTNTPDGKHALLQGDRLALPKPPPWRDFQAVCRQAEDENPYPASKEEKDFLESIADRHCFREDQWEVEVVKAALILRRPILITGAPGVGKSSLAYVAAHYLNLGPVLRWNINSKSTLREGFYDYDPIGRLQDHQWRKEVAESQNLHPEDPRKRIGDYFQLGPLGTALLPRKYPRVLLIDEIDKSDLDLPNDLLHALEEGRFEIPELKRIEDLPEVPVLTADKGRKASIENGEVSCYEFPLILMTSNGERDFSSAFLRRCLHLTIDHPTEEDLTRIVTTQLEAWAAKNGHDLTSKGQTIEELAKLMVGRIGKGEIVSTDQLLSTFFAEGFYGFDSRIRENSMANVKKSPEVRSTNG